MASWPWQVVAARKAILSVWALSVLYATIKEGRLSCSRKETGSYKWLKAFFGLLSCVFYLVLWQPVWRVWQPRKAWKRRWKSQPSSEQHSQEVSLSRVERAHRVCKPSPVGESEWDWHHPSQVWQWNCTCSYNGIYATKLCSACLWSTASSSCL